MNITVIVNPHAGRGQAVREWEEVRRLLEGRGHTVRLWETETPDQAQAAVRAAAQAGGPLVCAGGDGTLSATVGHVLDLGARLDLGYLPAGTTNDFARFLNIPRDPVKAAQFLLDAAPRPLDAGAFGDSHFIYVASFGAFTKSSYATDPALKQALGHLAYVLESLRELPELKPVRLRAETAEGRVFEGEYLFGAVSDSTSIGGVFKPDPALVDPADGLFELTLLKNPRNLGEFRQALGAMLGGRLDSPWIEFTQTAGAAFSFEEPVPWTLDGEYAPGGERAEIAVLPQAVRLYY